VANPERLYDLSRQELGFDGKPQTFDGWAYPVFSIDARRVKDQAELIAVSYAEPVDLTINRTRRWRRRAAIRVAAGFSPALDCAPLWVGCSQKTTICSPARIPYAVLSHDYWRSALARTRKSSVAHFAWVTSCTRSPVCREPFTGNRARHHGGHLRAHDDESCRHSQGLDLASDSGAR